MSSQRTKATRRLSTGGPLVSSFTKCSSVTFTLPHAYLPLIHAPQTGLPPFYDENVNIMYQRILSDPLNFPPDVSPDAKNLMIGLLQRDPTRRLGAGGAEEIKRHPFFARHVDWPRLLAKKIQPPFKPSVVRTSCLSVSIHKCRFLRWLSTGGRDGRAELRRRVHERDGARLGR